MTLSLVIFLLSAGFLVGYWWKTMQVKEYAKQQAISACQREGVQFLDHTVAFAGFGLGRDSQEKRRLLRHFNFEFATDGSLRYSGRVSMAGNYPLMILMQDH